METSFVDRLISRWKAQGVSIASGNSEAALAEFEFRNTVRLPVDMRQYLASANGMGSIAGSDVDSNGFRFWPLEQIRSVPAVCRDAGVEVPDYEAVDQCFVIADYLDWSWAYAIDLSGRDPNSEKVVHIGTFEPKVIAHSFGQFINMYLEDAKALYVLTRDVGST